MLQPPNNPSSTLLHSFLFANISFILGSQRGHSIPRTALQVLSWGEELLTIWRYCGGHKGQSSSLVNLHFCNSTWQAFHSACCSPLPASTKLLPSRSLACPNVWGFSCLWCRTLHLHMQVPGGSCLPTASAHHGPSEQQICLPVCQLLPSTFSFSHKQTH